MIQKFILAILGLLFGIGVASIILLYQASSPQSFLLSPLGQMITPRHVVGFLPYWLLDKAQTDYSSSITTLTYFALRIDKDGSILKNTTPTQREPGWYALESGKVSPFLQNAHTHHLPTSLALDSGDANAINGFLAQPTTTARRLISDVLPLMQRYEFTDLNLDIEYTAPASTTSRLAFTQFIHAVRKDLPSTMTLTLEISTLDVIQPHLIDVHAVSSDADHIILMAYDYHTPDSFVTGPVAPLAGAGVSSEYDVTTALVKTLTLAPPEKVILGIPLYGYEWETLSTVPRSAVIPGSGVLASTNRAISLIESCSSCSAHTDVEAQESYVSYFSDDTNTTHILFFPTKESTGAKIQLADKAEIGGLALWALGYEDTNILVPLNAYKQE